MLVYVRQDISFKTFSIIIVTMYLSDKSQRTADDIMREVEELTGHSTDGATGRRLYTLDEDNIGDISFHSSYILQNLTT
jgi:hypothetical protein